MVSLTHNDQPISKEPPPSAALAELVRPYRLLHGAWREKLARQQRLAGWKQTACQLHFTMKCSIPLLHYAASQAAAIDESLFHSFIEWALHHAEEEKEHHNWLADDLKVLGIEKDSLRTAIPHEHILNGMGAHFALTAGVHPLAILGYHFVMECYPSDPKAVIEFGEELELPADALRTILYHTKADQDHRRRILDLVDRFGSDPFAYAAIAQSAISTMLSWTQFFKAACDG